MYFQLLKLFQNYTKNSPALGMTVEEFKKFLIEQQNVRAVYLFH